MALDWPTASIIVAIIVSIVSLVMKYVPAKARDDHNIHTLRNALHLTMTEVAVLKTQYGSVDRLLTDLKTDIHSLRADVQVFARTRREE